MHAGVQSGEEEKRRRRTAGTRLGESQEEEPAKLKRNNNEGTKETPILLALAFFAICFRALLGFVPVSVSPRVVSSSLPPARRLCPCCCVCRRRAYHSQQRPAGRQIQVEIRMPQRAPRLHQGGVPRRGAQALARKLQLHQSRLLLPAVARANIKQVRSRPPDRLAQRQGRVRLGGQGRVEGGLALDEEAERDALRPVVGGLAVRGQHVSFVRRAAVRRMPHMPPAHPPTRLQPTTATTYGTHLSVHSLAAGAT